MAIKPPDLLNRLPSVSDLLDKPPVRALADRLNRTVVAGRVRTFLDELQKDLRRRAVDAKLPSLRELAERAASYIVARQHESLGTAINATGRMWGDPWLQRPLDDATLERAVAVGREFVADSASDGAHLAAAESVLCRLTGAQAAAVVHSYPLALWLALSSLAKDREIVLARAEVSDVEPGEPLSKLAASAGVTLREAGVTNRAAVAEFDAAITARTAAIATLIPDQYRVVGDTVSAKLEELTALARDRAIVTVAAMGIAPLVAPLPHSGWPHGTVREAVGAAVDVVIVRGDGMTGGPACGILVGNHDSIERIKGHSVFAASRLDPMRTGALAAALESTDSTDSGVESLPICQLLTTPLENLRNRAERLAPQLAQCEMLSESVAIETHSLLSGAFSTDRGYLSWGIALMPREGTVAELDQRLRAGPMPIIGRVESDRLVLDLRTVLPRQDRMIVEAILGTQANERAESPVDPGIGPKISPAS